MEEDPENIFQIKEIKNVDTGEITNILALTLEIPKINLEENVALDPTRVRVSEKMKYQEEKSENQIPKSIPEEVKSNDLPNFLEGFATNSNEESQKFPNYYIPLQENEKNKKETEFKKVAIISVMRTKKDVDSEFVVLETIETNSDNEKRVYSKLFIEKSKKNTTNCDIIIGRDLGIEIIPIDISLQNNLVSRVHCKICKRNDKFYIVDVGSVQGTFLKNSKCLVHTGHRYFLGPPLFFDVEEIILPTDPKCLDGKNDDSLIKFLIDNHKNDKSYISAEAEIMAKCEERLKKKTEENLSFFNFKYNASLLKIKVFNFQKNSFDKHIFVATNNQKDFFIGRLEENTLCINSQLISGKHLKISYSPEENAWKAEDLNSTNGFWISINDYRYMSKALESEEKELQNKEWIRISNYELKFEML